MGNTGINTGAIIQANLIGTNASGTAAIGNGFGGILFYRAENTTIGGPNADDGNLISGNSRGIDFALLVAGTKIQGNKIGTDITGVNPIPNTLSGIRVYSSPSASDVLIGGAGAAANVIAFNGTFGITIESTSSQRLSFLGNAIYGNGTLSIDLEANGATTNDPNDIDDGANGRQNYPEILAAVRTNAGTVSLHYTLDTNGSQQMRLEFFSSPSCGVANLKPEARSLIRSSTPLLDATGDLDVTNSIATLPAGTFLAATATDGNGSTSELSPCVAVAPRPPSDVTCDDLVNGVDALAILRSIAGFSSGVLPQQCAVDAISPFGDANQDMAVNVLDALFARKAAAGLP